jgi:FkbM family methyltransferase
MPSFPVRRRIFGLKAYFDSRDHPWVWYGNRQLLEDCENLPEVLSQFRGKFWDVGCNAGVYSLYMASRGNRVVAFDLSPKNIQYLEKSARANRLYDIIAIPRAFSVENLMYREPASGAADNQLIGDSAGDRIAITYRQAAHIFGIPALIKMDIEGHEIEFLKCPAFKQWIVKNKICIIMEVHGKDLLKYLWPDVKTTPITDRLHFLIDPR